MKDSEIWAAARVTALAALRFGGYIPREGFEVTTQELQVVRDTTRAGLERLDAPEALAVSLLVEGLAGPDRGRTLHDPESSVE